MICLFAWILVFCTVVSARATSDYSEKLDLRPLPPNSLLASFNFKSNSSETSFNRQNYRYFPRSLGQILHYSHAKELHLRFTTGRWDAESWGERPWHGFKEGTTGVELWAWIEAASNDEAYARWISLTQSLSGLFCASLNFVDSTKTTSPVVTFDPVGDHPNTGGRLHLLHGTLPGEVVCTENLTPLVKLLPCKGKTGISSLFDGHKLFDATWQTMSIDVQPLCPGSECVIEMDETIDMVLDIDRSKRPRDNPIPKPVPSEELECDQSKEYNSDDTCYPVDNRRDKGWRLSEVFGHEIPGSCPLTGDDARSVCLHVPNSRDVYVTAGSFEMKDPSGNKRCYSIPDDFPFDFVLPEQETHQFVPTEEPILYAERTTIGRGQERGGMRSILRNPSTQRSVDFIYFETLPWFLRPYLHTLRAQIHFDNINNGSDDDKRPRPIRDLSTIVHDVFYRPAIDRQRGTQLELHISIPAGATVTLLYDFEKAILRYSEYPPDANRGFNLAPAVVRILGRDDNGANEGDGKNNSNAPIYLRTTSLLLPLPTPDFSMPYNVIILTSTVIALAFGSIYNLLTRRFVGVDEARATSLKVRVVGRLVAIKDRVRGKVEKVE